MRRRPCRGGLVRTNDLITLMAPTTGHCPWGPLQVVFELWLWPVPPLVVSPPKMRSAIARLVECCGGGLGKDTHELPSLEKLTSRHNDQIVSPTGGLSLCTRACLSNGCGPVWIEVTGPTATMRLGERRPTYLAGEAASALPRWDDLVRPTPKAENLARDGPARESPASATLIGGPPWNGACGTQISSTVAG